MVNIRGFGYTPAPMSPLDRIGSVLLPPTTLNMAQERAGKRIGCLQFSLRTAVVLFIATCAGVGYYANKPTKEAEHHNQLRDEIERMRGDTLSYEPKGWLYDIHPVDVHRVWYVDLMDKHVPDPLLQRIGKTESIKQLYLYNADISDDDLVHIGSLPELEWLDIRNNDIHGHGLEHFQNCPNLDTLWMGWNPIEEDGLEHLASLESLKVLTINDSKLNDAGLKKLETLPHLTELNIDRTNVTEPGIIAFLRTRKPGSIFMFNGRQIRIPKK